MKKLLNMKLANFPILGILCLMLTVGCKNDVQQEKLTVKSEPTKDESVQGTPKAVVENFKKMFPGENNADWEQDANGYWEARFNKDDEKYRADFNADGSWIETENSIKKENLSDQIKKVIERDYSEYEITEVEYVNHHSKGEFFDVEFKQEGKNKDVEFRENGEIIN
ncbi:Putative beta-lactamase-inhibitor-like, PepSY-like [Flavobacteriaceae bacterium MAR_2010_188]|nr:Putative beta-lactamase-inhibitor-like, PepSY-like [Flavobacteriaceae bacterium MAR_2010_188]